jgi:hypothetical protein
MTLARVVTFDGVSDARVEEMKARMGEGRPEDIPATEIMMLYDAEAHKSEVILLFDNEEDYAQADATLAAMPADETPGTRTAVERFEVAVRETA